MRELIGQWRAIAIAYFRIKSPVDDVVDLAAAFLFAITAVLLGIAVSDIFGGCHG